MVRLSTACSACRRHRRKCVRSSLNDVCDRCKATDRTCTVPGEICITADEDINRLVKKVKTLNSMIAHCESDLKMLQKKNEANKPEERLLENYQWEITIQNGHLRIETGIRNISDLLQINSIRYLSPRLSDQNNQDLVIHFNIGKTQRLRMITTKLLTYSTPKKETTALLLPTALLFNPAETIDTLIDIYFKCHNIVRPMLHQPTFMKHYKTLKSPFDSLICLSICSNVCIYPCYHSTFSNKDLRSMGDYFAGLVKSKILDQFDLPEKRLENVIALNMLGEYFYTVLDLSENIKWISMGIQICEDLKPWYDLECQKPGTPSVECVLFSRHYAVMLDYSRLSDVIIHKTEHLNKIKYFAWKYLPDEPQIIIDTIKGQNLLYKLMSNPIIAKIRLYRHHFFADAIHTLKFTDIILVDEIIMQWWRELPLRFRISENWLDMQQLKTEIDKSTDIANLIFLAYFYSFMNEMYATLLTPNDADSILSMIQERALERCLHCSQLSLYIINRPTKVKSISPCHYEFVSYECLIHTLDVLSILTTSSNLTIKTKAKHMLAECMVRTDDMIWMRNHKVDPIKSPLSMINKVNHLNEVDTSVYYEYLLPWCAAVSDICHYLEKTHL